jgi:hypothetical protein
MNYLKKTFSVPVASNQTARDNWDRTFPPLKPPPEPPCDYCGQRHEDEACPPMLGEGRQL